MSARPKGPQFRTVLAMLLFGCAIAMPACRSGEDTSRGTAKDTAKVEEPALDLFREMTEGSGVNVTYRNGQEADHYAILESLGGGAALLDYDGDGLLDLYVAGGGYYDGPDKQAIKGLANKLYRNLGGWKFQDVTAQTGLGGPLFYTHGAAVADYDRDGWPDLLVTGWGRVVLYHNVADGKGGRRFEDVTKAAGLTDQLWSTSAAWADLDGDGFPDLYVCQYVDWSFEKNPPCPGYSAKVPRDVCPPKTFNGLPHKLYRNNGNGTFSDTSKEAGLKIGTSNDGKGLGVVIVDVNADRKPDIYVANDTVDNFLYINRSTPGKLLFDEVGLPSGVARDERGVPNGSMGVDTADYDGSGRASLWVTNYENEFHGLYRNRGKGLFLFSTTTAGIAAIGQLYVGFGTGFLDVENDSWEDLMVSNGHVIRHPVGATLQQRPVLLRNKGLGKFIDLTRHGGPYFRSNHIGRGVALGDLDNDGWIDLVVSHLNEPVSLLRNDAKSSLGEKHHWLGLELEGEKHRDLVGTKLVVDAGGRLRTHFHKGGGSYLSACDARHVFGLGTVERIDRLTITWPSGQEQQWTGAQLPLGRYHRLVEGQAAPAERRSK